MDSVLEWVYYARFGALPPRGITRKELDKELRRLERENYIYYTRVDGKKCHRLLTAKGAKALDQEKKERRERGS